MENKQCIICGEQVPIEKKDQRFCCSYCRIKNDSREKYYKHKDDAVYRAKMKKNFKIWYNKNKDRQKVSIMKSYRRNKSTWALRTFNVNYRKKIQAILPKVCYICGKKGQEYVGIKDTRDTAKPRMHKGEDALNYEKLKDHCKKLVNLCSRDCLGKLHRKEMKK
jgi:hypothetical protein